MRERIEQSRFQTFALATCFEARRDLLRSSAFDGNGDQLSDRLHGDFGWDRIARDAQAAERGRTQLYRNDQRGAGRISPGSPFPAAAVTRGSSRLAGFSGQAADQAVPRS